MDTGTYAPAVLPRPLAAFDKEHRCKEPLEDHLQRADVPRPAARRGAAGKTAGRGPRPVGGAARDPLADAHAFARCSDGGFFGCHRAACSLKFPISIRILVMARNL